MHKCPVTVTDQAKILPAKTLIFADNCSMTDYYLQPCHITTTRLNSRFSFPHQGYGGGGGEYSP